LHLGASAGGLRCGGRSPGAKSTPLFERQRIYKEGGTLPLDTQDIDSIVARLAELLERPVGGRTPKGLVTAKEVAACLGVARGWVYANQERLGVVRLGEGPKARLRFDLDRAAEALRCGPSAQSAGATTSPVSRSSRRWCWRARESRSCASWRDGT
jgi:hypothetical protein